MSEVFISYSSKNKDTAYAICDAIEHSGVKCWIAPRNILGGISFASEIVKGIKACRLFVVILSQDTNGSEHVLNEINFAVNNAKIIIPYKIDSSLPNDDYVYYLGKTHWIDGIFDPKRNFGILVSAINDNLNGSEAVNISDIKENRKLRDINTRKLIESTKEERLSFGLSIDESKNDCLDFDHFYDCIKRIDILSATSGSYASYRWLQITNKSDEPTCFLEHKECGENKIYFDKMRVKAFATNYKGESLKIESTSRIQPNFIQTFRIYFPRPLKFNENICVFYRIDWPGEPNSYWQEKLSQSISLVRYKKGVGNLIFGILDEDKMIDFSLLEYDSKMLEKQCNLFPRYIKVQDDDDLKPLHDKELNGIVYNIDTVEAETYRLFYKVFQKQSDEDFF